MFAFGGECDFYFNPKKEKVFRKILKDNPNEELTLLLDYCCSMHHNQLNLSIMARTGGLNSFKGLVFLKATR